MLHGSTNRLEPCELDQNIPPERVCLCVLISCVLMCVVSYAETCVSEKGTVECMYGITLLQAGQTPRFDGGAPSAGAAPALLLCLLASLLLCLLEPNNRFIRILHAQAFHLLQQWIRTG